MDQTASDVDAVRSAVAELLADCRFGVLGTRGTGAPHLSLVAIAGTSDLRSIIFATDRSTQKYRNLLSQPKASIQVDNRSELTDDIERGMALTATGTTVEASGGAREQLAATLLGRHGYMSGFLASDGCAILSLNVAAYHLVRGLSDVRTLHMTREVRKVRAREGSE